MNRGSHSTFANGNQQVAAHKHTTCSEKKAPSTHTHTRRIPSVSNDAHQRHHNRKQTEHEKTVSGSHQQELLLPLVPQRCKHLPKRPKSMPFTEVRHRVDRCSCKLNPRDKGQPAPPLKQSFKSSLHHLRQDQPLGPALCSHMWSLPREDSPESLSLREEVSSQPLGNTHERNENKMARQSASTTRQDERTNERNLGQTEAQAPRPSYTRRNE